MKSIQTLKTNISVTSDRIWIKLYSLDSPHQDESNGSIFIQFWLLVTEIFVFKVFVKLYIKLLTNQNYGLIAELRIIKVLRTLRIFRLKIRKWLQYLNLQLICNLELQVPSLASGGLFLEIGDYFSFFFFSFTNFIFFFFLASL